MTEKRGTILPPPPEPIPNEDRPTKPLAQPSASEQARIDAETLVKLTALAREALEKAGKDAEAREGERITSPGLALAREYLRDAAAGRALTFNALSVQTGIVDVEGYNKWLQAKIEGDSPEKA